MFSLDLFESLNLFFFIGYCRIDGGTTHGVRVAAIHEYDKPGNEKFIFVLMVWAVILHLLMLSFCMTVIGMCSIK
jgi:SWI/SNF-related matrix-associated actin-dependent regulator of chromatin subfamily A member 5